MSLPNLLELVARLVKSFKGENAPQSPAGLYEFSPQIADPLALSRFAHVAGPETTFNNLCDIDRLLQTITHCAAALEKNAGGTYAIAVAAKHGNPCGAAYHMSEEESLRRMVTGDTRAIYGGVVIVNFRIESKHVGILLRHASTGRRLLSAVVAPSFAPDAIIELRGKTNKTALLCNQALAGIGTASLDQAMRVRYVRGGILMQPNYTYIPHLLDAEHFGAIADDSVFNDVAFAWAICATSNSNTVTIVKDQMLVGNGVGQQDRVGAAELALKRAHDAGHTDLSRSVAASDSFFPFDDGPQRLIEGGVRTIFATSGSKRDIDVQKLIESRNATILMLPDSEARGFYAH